MNKKPWEEMSFGERAATLPKRHPFPVQCLIWLFIEYGFNFTYLPVVARAMGWIEMTESRDIEFEGFKGTLATGSWIDLNQVEAPKDEE